MAVAPNQNKAIMNAIQHTQSNLVLFRTWNIVKILTSHNQANSSAYYINQRLLHFIKKIILQVASALSTISVTHSIFHALKIKSALKLSFLLTLMHTIQGYRNWSLIFYSIRGNKLLIFADTNFTQTKYILDTFKRHFININMLVYMLQCKRSDTLTFPEL